MKGVIQIKHQNLNPCLNSPAIFPVHTHSHAKPQNSGKKEDIPFHVLSRCKESSPSTLIFLEKTTKLNAFKQWELGGL